MTAAAIIARVATRIPAGNSSPPRARRPKPVRRTGRPSRADAALLRERILESATELFLEDGYGATSIEAVAARAGISKRTFYDRFDDKPALFHAVVHRIIDHIRPPAGVPLIAGATVAQVLQRLAGLMLKAALAPRALALHRLVVGESRRFPELAVAGEGDRGKAGAIGVVSQVLAGAPATVRIRPELRGFAAEQFIHLVVTVPQRRALGFGTPMTPADIEAWTSRVVVLFLEGCRGLRGTTHFPGPAAGVQ
jgi:TetR/AcrR family transcriptional regulator, mexJK operon transcriptional repressor